MPRNKSRGGARPQAKGPKSSTQMTNQRTSRGVNRSQQNSAPVARARRVIITEPVIRQGRASTRIRHRELVTTVSGSVSFTATGFKANPGLSSTFPWLSTQASGWEQYRFHRLRFEYFPRTATTKVGSVILAPDYDVLDDAPASEQQACSYLGASEDASWVEQCVELDTGAMFPLGPRKYIRDQMIAGADEKTYDAAQFFICTTEQDNTDAVGKLWVEYDVEFFVPQTEGTSTPQGKVSLYNLSSNNSLTTTVEETLPFDEEVTDGLGISNSSGVFTLPKGTFIVQTSVTFDSSAATAVGCNAKIYKDGAAMTIPVNGNVTLTQSSAASISQITLQTVIVSDGTTTCEVKVSMTAGGTLNNLADYCRILFTCV